MAKPLAPPVRKPARRWPGPLQFMAALGAYQIVSAHHLHATAPTADEDTCDDARDEDAMLAAQDDWVAHPVTDHDSSDT